MSEAPEMLSLGDREPLDERILATMDDVIPFSMKEIQEAFPNETYWPLYRALEKLEKAHKVTFYKIVTKKKYFRKAFTNALPQILDNEGKPHPITMFLTEYKFTFDSDRKVWVQMDKVNRVPILFAYLFVIASQLKDQPKELKQQWKLVHQELMEARTALLRAVAWIDQVTEHDSMTGNMDKFLNAFTGEDAPDIKKVHEFLGWYNKLNEVKE